MYVSGFTFVRNAIKLDYPVEVAIRSVLPLVDEMIVAVGDSEDETRSLIASVDTKIKIVDSIWDESLRQGGKVLAVETDKALDHVKNKADWCIYIQADECLHEQDYQLIKDQMYRYKDRRDVDGFLFNYLHFYGSYDFLGDSRTWYRREVRIIRNDPQIRSWKDAQGFRKNEKKLNVIPINARVYHYGWVRHPEFQIEKQRAAHKLWHSDEFITEKFSTKDTFDYNQVDSVKPFKGSHPGVMKERIAKMNWTFDRDPSRKKFGLVSWLLYKIEQLSGWRPGEYRNYRMIGERSN